MTKQRDFKAIVRARMAVTGEKYTQARVAILADRAQGKQGAVDFDGTVHQDPGDHQEPRARAPKKE